MELLPGVYESLINNAVQLKLKNFTTDKYLVKTDEIDGAESPKMLAEYIGVSYPWVYLGNC